MFDVYPLKPRGRLIIQRGLPTSIHEAALASAQNPAAGFVGPPTEATMRESLKQAFADGIKVEDLVDPAGGQASAYVFNMANGDEPGDFEFEATLEEFSSTEGVQGNRLSITLHGVGRDIIDRIPANAAVQLELGYAGGYPSDLRRVFYGILLYALPHRSGGKTVWQAEATATPLAILNVIVPVSAKKGQMTYGAAMRDLMTPLGVKLVLPPVFDGVIDEMSAFTAPKITSAEMADVGNYTSKVGAIAEFRALLTRFNDLSGGSFMEVPSHDNLLEIEVLHAEGYQGEILELDLNAPVISSVSPTRATSPPPVATGPPTDLISAASIFATAAVERMQITMALDPRVKMGMKVRYPPVDERRLTQAELRSYAATLDFGAGALTIDTLSHSTGDWSTTISGKLTAGDPFVPTA